MLLMRGGKIVADGDATDFAAQDLLTEAYFGGAA
jgi:branched-chain amino acid transport system ATP-binding protein